MTAVDISLRKRVNTSFWVLCLLFVVTYVATVPSIVWQLLYMFGVLSPAAYESGLYFSTFVLPQFLYPVLSFCVMLLVPKLDRCSLKAAVKTEDVPVLDTVLCIFSFMGLSVGASYISMFIESLLEKAGLDIPDMSLYIPDPSGAVETVMFFVVIAVLPAIFEELIYRGIIAGTIKGLNPKAAVILSALAFGLIHGTVQQIPMAFIVGLLLGVFYILYDSIVLCIALHFLNNFVSCIFTVLGPRLSDETYMLFSNIFDITFAVLGTLSAVILIILWNKRKKTAGNETFLPPPVSQGRAAVGAVLSSTGLWAFVLMAVVSTVMNILMLALI